MRKEQTPNSPESLAEKYAEEAARIVEMVEKTRYETLYDFRQGLARGMRVSAEELAAANREFAQRTLRENYESRMTARGKPSRAFGALQTNAFIDLKTGLKGASEDLNRRVQSVFAELDKNGQATVFAATNAIREEFAKNGVYQVTYQNGSKVELASYAKMAARSARTETLNLANLDAAKRLGTDLVKCTKISPTCELCAMYQDRVYSVSGRDKRFPALYETALKKGYHLMHPNCRHEFLPYFEELQTKEQLEKDIERSNRPFQDVRGKKERDAYAEWQLYNRQVRDERMEYNALRDTLGDKMPYKTIGGFRRARRAKSPEYLALRRSVRKIREGATREIIPPYHKVIDMPEYREKFEHLDLPPKVVTAVKNAARRCIKINDQTTLERAVFIDAKTGKEMQTVAGRSHEVEFSTELLQGLSVVCVHNHPKGETFSALDLYTLSQETSIHTMIAAGHNGNVYTLSIEKGKRIDKNIYLEYNTLKEECNGNLNRVLETLAQKYSWRYQKR